MPDIDSCRPRKVSLPLLSHPFLIVLCAVNILRCEATFFTTWSVYWSTLSLWKIAHLHVSSLAWSCGRGMSGDNFSLHNLKLALKYGRKYFPIMKHTTPSNSERNRSASTRARDQKSRRSHEGGNYVVSSATSQVVSQPELCSPSHEALLCAFLSPELF